MASKFNFKGIQRKSKLTIENSLTIIGNEAKRFFVENFRKQGFDDASVEKWKPRKQYEHRHARNAKQAMKFGLGRAILVKSGDLRRSIKRMPPQKSNLSIRIVSDLPYAKIHNEGLEGNAFGKHKFKMPKREFMGNSFNLNERIKKILYKRLDLVFK